MARKKPKTYFKVDKIWMEFPKDKYVPKVYFDTTEFIPRNNIYSIVYSNDFETIYVKRKIS